ncbi:hypothetical protein [Aquirufa lenticrescens]|nr:hypothetical protein [Aquirufa lenticrescens]UAJ14185.1 hypothetical protein G9X62_06260 [Aquirufa lenticrescens]
MCQYAKMPFSPLKVFQLICAIGAPQGYIGLNPYGLSDAVVTKAQRVD